MRVAIVVPFHAEPLEQLEQCISSVLEQSHGCELVLVGDGPRLDLAASKVVQTKRAGQRVLWLPLAHGDFGNCARAVGCIDAMSTGADAVGFLDADNWLAPDHVEKMIETHQKTGAPLVVAGRWIARVDGSVMARCADNDGETHADTSTILVTREAFHLLPLWSLVPKELAPISDRVWFMLAKTSKVQRAFSSHPTVFYRTRYAAHYRAAGETPPPEAKEVPNLPPGDYRIELPQLRLGLQIDNTA
jgi:glycosyltransferase involved in cell wall biosynthesis